MSTVRKRLHVSGLTPAITANDINARLQGFGKVWALDGLGAMNAVGEPRNFAYVTLEATEANVARCLNVLSGTTWKGTKLRIGEARPDFAQRLENERKRAADGGNEHPAKKRRLPRGVQGVHAKDMSVVSLENVDSHPGWHTTPLSHLIRPMKMRPSHPLPELSGQQKNDSVNKKRKNKPTPSCVPTRARVRRIDPRLYGAVHLREDMLEAVVESQPLQAKKPSSLLQTFSSSDVPNLTKEDTHPSPTLSRVVEEDQNVGIPDFEKEKARDLDLLTTMFGDDKSERGGTESIEDLTPDATDQMHGIAATREVKSATTVESKQTTPSQAKKKSQSLKDMFRPHEEEAGFSLMANLGDIDLDLDPALDLVVPASSSTSAPVPTPAPAPAVPTVSHPAPSQPGLFTLDPTLPFFFPHPDNPRAKDLFAFARIEGWEFGRSGDSEFIRKRWNDTKVSLTREYKKRHREAVKAQRRRYGARGIEDA